MATSRKPAPQRGLPTLTDTMLIGYLPKQKVLIEADVYTPGPAHAPTGPPTKENMNLYGNILGLKLDVQQIMPIHGRLVTIADLRRLIGR